MRGIVDCEIKLENDKDSISKDKYWNKSSTSKKETINEIFTDCFWDFTFISLLIITIETY